MQHSPESLIIRLEPGEQYSDKELFDYTRQFQNELSEYEIEDVRQLTSEDVPEGAKSGSAISLGTLLVTLATSGVLTTIVVAIKEWINRNEKDSITIEKDGKKITINGATKDQIDQLMKDWITH